MQYRIVIPDDLVRLSEGLSSGSINLPRAKGKRTSLTTIPTIYEKLKCEFSLRSGTSIIKDNERI